MHVSNDTLLPGRLAVVIETMMSTCKVLSFNDEGKSADLRMISRLLQS